MKKDSNVDAGETELQSKGHDLVSVHPYTARGTYAQIMGQFEERGLEKPTFFDTVVLAHAAWQSPDEKSSKEIIDLMNNYWLVTDTGLLYLPDYYTFEEHCGDAVYIQDHPDTDENGLVIMDEETLASKIEAGDPNVRFAGPGYKLGVNSAKQLAQSWLIVKLCGGEKNVNLLAELSSKYGRGPHVWAFPGYEVKEPITRVVALGVAFPNESNRGLIIDGRFLESNQDRLEFHRSLCTKVGTVKSSV